MPHEPADFSTARSPGPSDDPVLLPHDQLIDELQTLCAAKRSGTMFIITAENHVAQFVLRDGVIVGLTYRLLRGPAALPLLRTFPAGRYRFQTETVDHTDQELPATADLLTLLIPEPASAVGPPQAEPATDTRQVPEAVRLLIERELAEVVGPIAGLICQEHFAHAGHLDWPNDLVRVLEAIAIEIGDPAKAAGFKHEVLSKFNTQA